jgi:hypothetical protein
VRAKLRSCRSRNAVVDAISSFYPGNPARKNSRRFLSQRLERVHIASTFPYVDSQAYINYIWASVGTQKQHPKSHKKPIKIYGKNYIYLIELIRFICTSYINKTVDQLGKLNWSYKPGSKSKTSHFVKAFGGYQLDSSASNLSQSFFLITRRGWYVRSRSMNLPSNLSSNNRRCTIRASPFAVPIMSSSW